jgi:hypothetical protein
MERALLGGRLGGEGVELLGWGEALFDPLFDLAFPQHMHELNPGEGTLRGVEGLEPQHGTGDSLHAAMVLFNGMVTHDKCCLIRHCQVQLRWSRQPYRFRPRTSDDLLDETSHREGSHETLLADTAAIPAHGGRGTAMGSGVPIPAALDDTFRTVRRALAISHTTDGGDP